MQSFWCICIRVPIIQLKVCKTDRIVYEDTTAEKGIQMLPFLFS